MSKADIYYFSGTGNSLHIAKELQQRIPDSKLIPVVSLLQKDIIKTDSEVVGFVFPVYLMMVPVPVRKFLKKLDLKSSKYFFSVATRGGTPSMANIYIEKILREKGKRLDSNFNLNMPMNTPAGIKPTPGDKNWVNQITKEKISILESVIQKDLDSIQKVIMNKEKYPYNNSPNFLQLFFVNLFHLLTDNMDGHLKYFTDSTCNGCGICEKVCLSKKIKIINKKPEWRQNIKCYYCFACFNCCPNESILLKNYMGKNGRYIHPAISVNDIAGQKLYLNHG